MSKKKTKKKAAKSKVAKKGRVHRGPARHKVKKKAAKKKTKKIPPGYKLNPGGKLAVPIDPMIDTVVEPAKITSGLKGARQQIQDLMGELSELTEGFDVSEVSLAVSFSADGKFLGVGVGGATSISIRLTPSQDG